MKLLFSIFLLTVSHLALATTVVLHDFPQLTQRADAVVRASIQNIQIKTSTGKIKVPITEVKATVLQIYKPGENLALQDIITLRKLGGKVGNRSVIVPGTEEFQVGQECVLFLEKTPQDYFVILGMAQGKFDITSDPTTLEKFVVRNTHQLHLIPNNIKSVDNLYTQPILSANDSKMPLSLLEKMINNNL